jgi:short-subunit dehydrogenase
MIFEQLLRLMNDAMVLLIMLFSFAVRIVKAVLYCGGGTRPYKTYNSILITGASYGIGAGLALAFAKDGVRLVLVARSKDRLKSVAEACRSKGSNTTVIVADVTDEESMRKAVLAADDEQALDLVVANAGVVSDCDGLTGSTRVIETNLFGMINTVLPIVDRFRARRCGQLVMLSSLAALAPPTNLYMTPYVASKAAIVSYAHGLRAGLQDDGVGVQVILPGFVESDMTSMLLKQRVQLYGMWTTEYACNFMKASIERNEPQCVFPFWLYFVTCTCDYFAGLSPEVSFDLFIMLILAVVSVLPCSRPRQFAPKLEGDDHQRHCAG